MDRYHKGEVLGQGTFGLVTKGIEKETGRICALKKIRLGKVKEGINGTALREIKCLKELHHEHVIQMIDVFGHKRNLYLVFEYMESDLEVIIKDRRYPLERAHVKAYLKMTLEAVAYCHKNWVLHRDLKPNNLLIGPDGNLKLADFGLARIYGSPDRRLTSQVFQEWYRAPELLYGAKHYAPSVDMWAVGCIFAEMMLRRPFFQGNSIFDQLGKVFAALGTPSEEQWPGMRSLPDFIEYVHTPPMDKRQIFTTASEDALNLLTRLLSFDPNRRITAEEALQHRYFKTSPMACPFQQLPRFSRGSEEPQLAQPAAPPMAAPRPSDSPDELRKLALRRSFPPREAAASAKLPPRAPSNSVAAAPATAPSKPIETTSGGSSNGVMTATPGSAMPMSMEGVSVTGTSSLMDSGHRPGLSSDDLGYLRKRKLMMDQAFDDAGQDVDRDDMFGDVDDSSPRRSGRSGQPGLDFGSFDPWDGAN
ncbi:hypothetical protein CYMTET_19269 [Cymbomonas tetramitiformis]|uniref:[RNA-polymerase]-subunit kinase n=1 Tax=Cymbomonas tetramitiformis TaxID=36881 RepID=A0AAE0L5E0_9CHLO|nr:hypothetical protein CYMTET_19269 [Cymbomonas tetramitiformis]